MWGWEAEIVIMLAQAKEYLESPETRKDSLLETLEGAFLTPWFWNSGLQNYEKLSFCYFKPPVFGYLLSQPRILIHPAIPMAVNVPSSQNVYTAYLSPFDFTFYIVFRSIHFSLSPQLMNCHLTPGVLQ